MRELTTETDFAAVLTEPLAVIYKHSPICPTSDLAYKEMRSLRRMHGDVPVYLVDVVHSRPLARYLAGRLGIVHASPQAIILRAGVPAWHGSHYELCAEELARKLDRLKQQPRGEESLP